MKRFLALLAACLLCGCARAEGIPAGAYVGEWNGGAWAFTVEDGVAAGVIDLTQEGEYTVAEDGSLNCQLLPHYDRYVFEPCPEGYRYDADGEWRVFAAQEDGSYVFTAADGTPGMTLMLSEDRDAILRKHWRFWTDYAHGQDPQTFTLRLGCHNMRASYEEVLVFQMEDGAFTPYLVMTGESAPEDGRFEFAGVDGQMFFYLDEHGDGTARFDFWVILDGELTPGVSYDLTRGEDGAYRGERDILWLHDDGSFTIWETFERYSALGSGMTYAYDEQGVLSVSPWKDMIRLEVTEEGVSLQYDDEAGYARRVTE